jgi:hypothetical protein
MADNDFVKAEVIAAQALGVLERELVLPTMVWRDAVSTFKGAKNDTVSIRVPAYTNSRKRDLRGAAGVAAPTGRQIITDALSETKVDVTLSDDIYKSVAITDEEMTLDIVDFGVQITNPVMGSVARGIEDFLAESVEGGTYEVELTIDEADPYLALVDARIALNNASVPAGQRGLAVGSSVEAAILKSDRLSKFDQSGSDTALRENLIGRIAGFTAVSVPGLDPDMAVAFHKSAFVLALVAPVVPDGATWGAQQSFNGMGMRVLRDYDYANVQDRFLADVFAGTAITADHGTIGVDGKFVPDAAEDPIVVRAVKLTLTGS